jgi:hypothetical protein
VTVKIVRVIVIKNIICHARDFEIYHLSDGAPRESFKPRRETVISNFRQITCASM